MSSKQFVIIGLGRFGSSVAKTLYALGHDVLAIDYNEDLVQEISDSVTHAVQMDATDENALRTFLDEYKASSENATTNIEETASLLEKYDIIKAAIATKAIPYCNICFITGDEMISKVTGYFKVLFDASPDSLGKKLPDNNILYIAK